MARKKTSKKKVARKPQGVSETLAIVSLILNILIIPGLGTLIGGKIKQGIWQLILLFGGITIGILLIISVIGIFAGIPILILGPLSAWIWGIVSGVQLIQESHK